MIDAPTHTAIAPLATDLANLAEGFKTQASHSAALRGQVVLITGDCRGAGTAIAQVLGEAGMRVVLADVDFQRAQDRAAVLGERDIPAMPLALDLNDPLQCAAAVETVVRRLGRLDVLVNQTATDVTTPLPSPGVDGWHHRLNADLSGPTVMSRYAGMQMRKQGGGHIINIAATASRQAWPDAQAHHAAVWGLQGLSAALQAELGDQPVRISDFVAHGPQGAHGIHTQDPLHVARAVRHVLQQPDGTVTPVLTNRPSTLESAWP